MEVRGTIITSLGADYGRRVAHGVDDEVTQFNQRSDVEPWNQVTRPLSQYWNKHGILNHPVGLYVHRAVIASMRDDETNLVFVELANNTFTELLQNDDFRQFIDAERELPPKLTSEKWSNLTGSERYNLYLDYLKDHSGYFGAVEMAQLIKLFELRIKIWRVNPRFPDDPTANPYTLSLHDDKNPGSSSVINLLYVRKIPTRDGGLIDASGTPNHYDVLVPQLIANRFFEA